MAEFLLKQQQLRTENEQLVRRIAVLENELKVAEED